MASEEPESRTCVFLEVPGCGGENVIAIEVEAPQDPVRTPPLLPVAQEEGAVLSQ